MTSESILSLIGNTPHVRLNHVVDSAHAAVYAKLEFENPGGSVKATVCLTSRALGRFRRDIPPR